MFLRISVGKPPVLGDRIVIDYRTTDNGPGPWIKVVESDGGIVTMPNLPDRRIDIRARVKDAKGQIYEPGLIGSAHPGLPPVNRNAIGDITLPDPDVKQTDGVLEITPLIPEGELASDFRIEIRHGYTGDAVKDSVFVAFTNPNQVVREHAWSENPAQSIFVRAIRGAEITAWTEKEITVVEVATEDEEDFVDDFDGGTYEPIVTGLTPLEEDGSGNLQFADFDIADADGVTIGNSDGWQVRNTGLRPGLGVVTLPEKNLPSEQTVTFQVTPEIDSIVRETLTIREAACIPICYPERDSSDQVLEEKEGLLRTLALAVDGDQMPILLEYLLAISLSASPTFTDSDYKPLVPGQAYRVRSYSMRVKVRADYGTNVKVAKVRVRRRCLDWCACCCCPDPLGLPD